MTNSNNTLSTGAIITSNIRKAARNSFAINSLIAKASGFASSVVFWDKAIAAYDDPWSQMRRNHRNWNLFLSLSKDQMEQKRTWCANMCVKLLGNANAICMEERGYTFLNRTNMSNVDIAIALNNLPAEIGN